MELLALVLTTFAAAFAAPLVHRLVPRASAWLLALVPAVIAANLTGRLPMVAAGGVVDEAVAWLPGAGVEMAMRLDGLSLLFGLLITVIGALVTIYAGAYLRDHEHLGRFYLYLFLFMGAMLGLVLADDLIALFVFWELTSLSSFFLIGFNAESHDSRRRAMQALLVTGGGGLALLAGLVLLGAATGSTTLSGANASAALAGSPLASSVLVLVLLGAFTKSAQFPFHFWLPGAMVAPSPVSAYLHSATMVKAGVYLLARLHPSLSGLPGWTPIVASVGFVTFAVGTVVALRQTDLKLILAYTTVASLGLMTFLLGLGTPHAAQAAIAFLLAHALYKGALFLAAGIVDHGAGTRDIRQLGGLRRAMPVTAAACAVAGLSFAGVPLSFGFIGKEAVFAAALEHSSFLLGATAFLFVGGVLAAGMVAIAPFWFTASTPGQSAATGGPVPAHADTTHGGHPHTHAHEGSWPLLAGPVVLGLGTLIFGILPHLADRALVSPAASAVLGSATEAHLALWHGINPVLLTSLAVLGAGAFLLPHAHRVAATLHLGFARFDPFRPERAYDATLAGLQRAAATGSGMLQHGRLRLYLSTMVAFALVAPLTAWVLRDGDFAMQGLDWSATITEWILVGLLIGAAICVTRVRDRIGAVAVLGVVGYAIAVLFILYGAPDLAMTQFLFETLSVLIFLLVLWGMPELKRRSKDTTRLRDGLLAGSLGVLVTFLVLSATTTTFSEPISSFYRNASYVEAHGRNVVNVILVDFRGLDTLGEITVLGAAALGVAALLRLRPGRGGDE